MDLKIEYKDISKLYKITVAKDEVRLKMPPNIEPLLKERLIEFTRRVSKQIYENFKHSMRGHVIIKERSGKFRVRMESDHRKNIEYITIEEN